MFKYAVLLIVFSLICLNAQDKAFITTGSNSIVIGNDIIERVINISSNSASTAVIKNKLSGIDYSITSDEFLLKIFFSGWGPAYTKRQNGENAVIMSSADFSYKGFTKEDLEGGGKKLVLEYLFDNTWSAFIVKVNYTVYPGKFYMRKWIEISDTASGAQFLDKLFTESITFKEASITNGKFGQPVFNNDIFIGLEYPTAENTIEHGKVTSGYLVGKSIGKAVYTSHTSVLGCSPSADKLEQYFMSYVDDIKVKGTRQFLLYNTWYDLRLPFMVDTPGNILNEENVLDRVNAYKNSISRENLDLNAFVVDLGWDKITAEWRIDTARFPNGFSKISESLKSMNTSLGLWASPFGGYEERDKRLKWAKENGYETTGDFLCFAGSKYYAAMLNSMAGYVKKYNIGYFKWDGLAIGCNELNHGHLPGAYSREVLVNNFTGMIDSVRKINPDIFINITIGTWLSPWWLKYADCVWMQGEDYGYADNVPCITDREKAITYKDGVLWDDLRDLHLIFPASSLMTHGIIKGSLNLLGGPNETLESFTNEVMMYFGRGVMMWELYLTPDLVSQDEWKSIASTVKWAKDNKDVLAKTKMILGNPLKQEPYGFIHLTKRKGILLLRNPDVNTHQVKIKLTPDLGDIDPAVKYYLKIIYPYNMILEKPVSINGELSLSLNGYEIITAELIPERDFNKNIPAGIKYSTDNNRLAIYGAPGESKQVLSAGRMKFAGSTEKIIISNHTSEKQGENNFTSDCSVNIPSSYSNARIGYLLEGKNIEKVIPAPKVKIEINGKETPVTIKQENGKWFWIFAYPGTGENKIKCSIQTGSKEQWKLTEWILADEKLESIELNRAFKEAEEQLPEKPYSANINKIIIPLK